MDTTTKGTSNIQRDLERFNRKVKGLTEERLDRYFSDENIDIPTPRGDVLHVPIRRLDLPHFRFDFEGQGYPKESGIQRSGSQGIDADTPWIYGVSEDLGSAIEELFGRYLDGTIDERELIRELSKLWREQDRFYDSFQDGDVDHQYRELGREDVAEYIAGKLNLPNLRETFSAGSINKPKPKHNTIRRTGPKGLRHFKKTYLEALKRQIASGIYNPETPVVVPVRSDERFRAEKVSPNFGNAVLIFLLDYSSSVNNTLEFLQTVAWWAECWIKRHYTNLARRYVAYDYFAHEKTPAEFYNISSAGQNNMGAGLTMASRILDEYPADQFNRYVMLLTDGDYAGLEITEQDIARYNRYAKSIGESKPLELAIGNPLTDLIFPEVDGLFVCEAGAYYDSNGSFSGKHEGGSSQRNFSELLGKLLAEDENLSRKVRHVSYTYDKVDGSPKSLILETLKTWFS